MSAATKKQLSHVFVSHSSKDDDVVNKLQAALGDLFVDAWTDSRRLTGGDKLEKKVTDAIESARHFVVVLSVNAINSEWVPKEIECALDVQKKRGEGYKSDSTSNDSNAVQPCKKDHI